MRTSTNGFTIVELLISIAVIAILATITIVTYNGAQNSAYDAAVQNDLRHIAKILDETRSSTLGTYYPTTNPTLATALPGLKVSKSSYNTTSVSYNLLFCWPSVSSPSSYTLLATSKSGHQFYITSDGKLTQYTGGSAWNDASPNTVCSLALPGSSPSGAGFSAGDTTTGPWRSWTGS